MCSICNHCQLLSLHCWIKALPNAIISRGLAMQRFIKPLNKSWLHRSIFAMDAPSGVCLCLRINKQSCLLAIIPLQQCLHPTVERPWLTMKMTVRRFSLHFCVIFTDETFFHNLRINRHACYVMGHSAQCCLSTMLDCLLDDIRWYVTLPADPQAW